MRFPSTRFLRRRLIEYGVFPSTVAGQITLYLLTLFLVLVVTRQLMRLAGRYAGAAELSGWVFGIGFVTAIFFLYIFLRWMRQVVMWRLRNRLMITYIFIGLIPVVLLILMALIVGYLFGGQFAALETGNDIQSELNTLEAANEAITAQVSMQLRRGRAAAEDLRTVLPAQEKIATRFPNESVSTYLNGEPVQAPSATSKPENLPAWLQTNFKGATEHGGRVWLTVSNQEKIGTKNLVVVSSVPFDEILLQRIAGELGRIDLIPGTHIQFGQGDATASKPTSPRPKDDDSPKKRAAVTGGSIPPQTGRFDQPIWFAAPLTVTDWGSGTRRQMIYLIHTRPSALYHRLFSASVESAQLIWTVLITIAILLGILEGFALLVGLRITRGITRSVSNLYRATTHINRGDFNHRIVIQSKDQLAALEGSFNSMTQSLQNLLREQKEKERLQSEIAIAQQVQAQLFPREDIQLSSLELHGVCKPARTVSGDYYDFLPLGGEKLGIAVGDISGKGISAALLMATVHSAVRVFEFGGMNINRALSASVGARQLPSSDAIQSPAQILWLLNRHLYNSTPEEKYATLFLSLYDGNSRTLTYSNGGHLPPMLVSRDGVHRLEHGGTVVGLFETMPYEEKSIVMNPGDIFLAFSDGVTEPENEFGEFGEHRLLETIRENFDLPLARISETVLTAVQDWIGAAEQPDDVTLVLARAR
jgi:phosphoserine phosphatase RsbU/P